MSNVVSFFFDFRSQPPQPVPPPSQSQMNQNQQQGGPPTKKMKIETHQPTVMKRTLVSLTSGNSSNDVRNAPGITRLAQGIVMYLKTN